MTDDLVRRLRELAGRYDEAAERIEKLEAALRPFAVLFLYPNDLGFEPALDIREDPDWDEDANDVQSENCFVLRRDIKAARAALGEKKDE